MRAAFLIGVFVLAGSGSHAQPGRVASAYTSLDLDRCSRVDEKPEPQSATWRCKGYAGVPLIVESGDDRYDLDAGRKDADELWSQSFDYPGATVEWRLAGGKPFAIIYRLNGSGESNRHVSRLVVETIGQASPGCRIASLDGRAPGANQQARAAADAVLNGTARCLNGKRLAAASATGKRLFPPWKAEADCYWVLTYPDGVAHRAWIAGSENGLFLNVVDDAITRLPVSDRLRFDLVGGRHASPAVRARGSHGDGDGATLLTLALDEPQRALISAAATVRVLRNGRQLLDLPTDSLPPLSALAACDGNPGPARFTRE